MGSVPEVLAKHSSGPEALDTVMTLDSDSMSGAVCTSILRKTMELWLHGALQLRIKKFV